MNALRTLLALLFIASLAACDPNPGVTDDDDDDATSDDDDATEPGPPEDPDVDSYVPAGYGPTSPVRVVYLGDSIAAGAGATSASLTYTALLSDNDVSTWAEHADFDLATSFPGIEVVDLAVGGATTATLNSQQLPNVTNTLGEVVTGETIFVVVIGGNDMQGAIPTALTQGEAAAEAALDAAVGNVEDMLDFLTDSDRFPDGSTVYMANVYEPTDAVWQTADCFFGLDLSSIAWLFDQANAEFRATAEAKGVSMIDMRGHFLGHGYYSSDDTIDAYDAEDPSLWFVSDCQHPNDRGHHEIRRLFHAAISGHALYLD